MTNQELIEIFRRNLWMIKRQTEGLDHADSLLQLPFRGNCLNWVLGHILQSRNGVLRSLGQEAILTETESLFYVPGSEPISDDSVAVHFDTLMARLQKSQDQLLHALETASGKAMSAPAYGQDKITVQDQINFDAWHETYHVGQLEYLRQLSGKNDKVI